METKEKERAASCALGRIFGYEPRIPRALMQGLGSAAAIFAMSRDELRAIVGPDRKILDGISGSALAEAEEELGMLERKGYRYLSWLEDDYPALLKECEDAPPGLYIRSASATEEIFNVRPAVAVVGTRDISPYGKEWCPKLVFAMSAAVNKPTVVSGLALGVDISAHMAALACGLPTIAVSPVGIDEIYPRSHRIAAEKIAASPGSAIITDFPPGTAPIAVNFLRRNRIIAGISQATVLVESKKNGGGMITARLASGYGREVFALEGRIDDIRSAGCNRLLKEKIAEPVGDLESFPSSLGLGNFRRRRTRDLEAEVRARYERTSDAGALAAVALEIKKTRGINIDELCRRLGIPYSRAAELSATLENDGFIDMDLLGGCSIHSKID